LAKINEQVGESINTWSEDQEHPVRFIFVQKDQLSWNNSLKLRTGLSALHLISGRPILEVSD
jgi:hypothetical protein